jgi:hypothetical protein
MHDPKNVVALLNTHDELALDHLVETRKQNAKKKAEEPQPVAKERTMRGLKLAESRWIAEDRFERAASCKNKTRNHKRVCLV